jgi:tRNA (cytidine/uridine-2'-O-)-methyltransferase
MTQLRNQKVRPTFGLNIVMVEPEIPQNTGSIGRTCLATGSKLHLIEPMGFEISEARLRRAGLDYWKHLEVKIWPGIEAFFAELPPDVPKVFTHTKGGKTLWEHRFQPGTWIFFGRETVGLPKWLLEKHADEIVRIPMYDDRVRSLNVSNSAAIVLYEAIRQLSFTTP